MSWLSNRRPPKHKWVIPTIATVAVVIVVGALVATVLLGGRIF